MPRRKDGLRLSQLNASELHKRSVWTKVHYNKNLFIEQSTFDFSFSRMSKNAKITEVKISSPPVHLHNRDNTQHDITDNVTENRSPANQINAPGKSPVHTIPATDDIKQMLLGLDQQKMITILNKINENEEYRPSMKIDGASDDDFEYVWIKFENRHDASIYFLLHVKNDRLRLMLLRLIKISYGP